MFAVPKSHHSDPVAHVHQDGTHSGLCIQPCPTGPASGTPGPASLLPPAVTDTVTHGRDTLAYRGKARLLNLAFRTSAVCCQPYFQGYFAPRATTLIRCCQTRPLQ